ncbi:MAG TPA: hypothetical protein VJZ94_01890 [Candidatus Paceibacterota bacterium]|uniref:Uncharacterized protein n=1 Tax=Candidatus Adlerbacteria bacterium RIFCSPHIGHO2_02_FULL_52_17 TaxID=1797240 RepID=A0A1F4XN39_9BACT|nr:MAG: hypothetical protein A3D68_01320 [Candidatus Adlerbacteria bacterium RIFCSPHIGHO2_02_FULL_52_17]HXK31472.1 hypothetical protein [Candidatus Paceibacterota bacterium]
MIVIGEIPTCRFDMPEDAGFFKETKIALLCKRSERKYDEGSSVIELFLKLENGKESLLLETDTVLEWWEIPNPAKDKRNWGKMRTLILKREMPDDAYIKVSLRSMLRKWKYSVDFGQSGTYFNIARLGHPEIVAKAERSSAVMPFLFDEPEPEYEEEELVRDLAHS